MKNIFRILMAVAVLLTASCAKEDISSSIAGGEVEVTFTANLPELSSRAYGMGSNANTLFYNVYEAGTEKLLDELCGTVDSTTGVFNFNLVLLKGMSYDLVFWAQNKDCGYYRLEGKKVTVSYNNMLANQDIRDAFYGHVKNFEPATATTTTFILTRPFAQLNAAVSASDMTAVGNSGVTLTTSAVKVDTYTAFDIYNGDVVGDKSNVLLKAAAMPCKNDETLPNKSDYTYLSMNYILVPAVGMVSEVEFIFNATKASDANFAFTGTTYGNVPLKRNYRTNILGNLLTKPTDFTVEIDEQFDTPDEDITVVSVSTASGLADAIAGASTGEGNSTEIILDGDIDLDDLMGLFSTRADEPSYGLLIPTGKEIVLNLGGHTLSQTRACTAHYSMIENKGNLTITNGTVSFKDNGLGDPSFGWGSYTITNYSVLTIDGATINNLSAQNPGPGSTNRHMYCAINQGAGAISTTINGGTINNPTYRSVRVIYGSLIINDGTFNGQVWMQPSDNNSSITINGGTFAPKGNDGSSVYVENETKSVAMAINGGYFTTKIGSKNPAALANTVFGGTFAVDPSAYVASTHTVVVENGLYVVKALEVGAIVEVDGQKGVIFSIENGVVKAVSVAELNLDRKTWYNALDWAAGLGDGWALASMEELNAIYDIRVALNDVLEADNAENSLFWEGDELYKKNGSVYYALYMSSDEVPYGEKDANGVAYSYDHVFCKAFNAKGYVNIPYAADGINTIRKVVPLRDNYFARAVVTL